MSFKRTSQAFLGIFLIILNVAFVFSTIDRQSVFDLIFNNGIFGLNIVYILLDLLPDEKVKR